MESLGCTVYAGCLLPKSEGAKKLNEKNSGLMHVLHLDVTNDGSVADAVQYVKKHSKETGLLKYIFHRFHGNAIRRVPLFHFEGVQKYKV